MRRESLEPLDLRLRRAMDVAWREAGEMERGGGGEVERCGEPPEALAARRLDFTRLQVAVEVLQRVLELCASATAP